MSKTGDEFPAPASAFTLPLRVYWEDTDAGGVVYYANYLKFCERARTEWLRNLGLEQRRLADSEGLLFVVSSAELRFLRPARLDDRLQVDVAVSGRGGASLDLLQRVWREGQPPTLLAQARVLVACVQAGSLRPRRLPRPLLQALDATAQAADAPRQAMAGGAQAQ